MKERFNGLFQVDNVTEIYNHIIKASAYGSVVIKLSGNSNIVIRERKLIYMGMNMSSRKAGDIEN